MKENDSLEEFYDKEYGIPFWISISIVVILLGFIIPWGVGIYRIAGKLFGF